MNLENSKTLLVGLWNPHSKYSKTRHNIGADILERLIVQNSLELKLDKSGMYKSGTLIIQENRVAFDNKSHRTSSEGKSEREAI